MGGSSSKVKPVQKILVEENRLIKENNALKTEVAELKKQLSGANALQSQVRSLEEDAESAAAAKRKVEEQAGALRANLEKLMNEAKTSSQQEAARVGEIATLTNEIQKLWKDNAALKAKIEVMRSAGGREEERRRRPRTGGPTLEPLAAAQPLEQIERQKEEREDVDVISQGTSTPSQGTPEEVAAATKIQASFRGHLVRKGGAKGEDGKGVEGDEYEFVATGTPEEVAAATKIQASFRGHQVRKTMPDNADADGDDDRGDGGGKVKIYVGNELEEDVEAEETEPSEAAPPPPSALPGL